jgi:hypothetical protein
MTFVSYGLTQHRAHQTALDLPASTFDPSPYLKLSGIAITLASVLETDNRPKEAWDVYLQALSPRPPTGPSSPQNEAHTSIKFPHPEEGQLSPQEIMRQVSIAHKLGEMAETYGFGEAEEEKWLTWSVERLVEVVKEHEAMLRSGSDRKYIGERGQEKPKNETREVTEEIRKLEDESGMLLADLDLPEWVTKTNLSAPLEALGAFYSRHGKVESV